MITDYLDHSANERTFLAWVRAAVTIMTLGFFIEEFDLHLSKLHDATSGSGGWQMMADRGNIHLISILLVVLGIAILASGTYRFATIKRQLEADEPHPYVGLRFALVISMLLGLFGVVLLLYLLDLL